jgi:hypothetical protein
MKKIQLGVLGLLAMMNSSFALAGAHVEHGGKNPNKGGACKEAKIGKIKPAALSEIAPGSDFSFMLFDANNPQNIEVTVKKIAIPVTIEDKGEMAIIHAKMPESLRNTAARINVKVKGKTAKCDSETGWLFKITP